MVFSCEAKEEKRDVLMPIRKEGHGGGGEVRSRGGGPGSSEEARNKREGRKRRKDAAFKLFVDKGRRKMSLLFAHCKNV